MVQKIYAIAVKNDSSCTKWNDLTKLYPNGMQSICIITFSKVLTKPLIDIIVGHRLIGLLSECTGYTKNYICWF